MAEYTARVNAIDSYTEDINTGAVSRGASLTATTKGYYNYNTGDSGYTEKLLRVQFPTTAPAGYGKKRLKAAVLNCFITAKQGSAGGSLPPGVTFGYGIGIGGAWGFLPGGVEGSFPGVPQNAYYAMHAEVQPFMPMQTIRVYAGTSDMPYSSINYSFNVSATLQSHTGANPPFVNYTYEDVVPTVTGSYPTGGFANEKQAVELGWGMSYDTKGVQATIGTRNARLRYRLAGASGYTELDYLRDKGSAWSGSPTRITIPANSGILPSAGNWEWQVSIQTDDNVWSAFTSWYSLTTVDSTSYSEAVRPKDAYVDGSENVVLEWRRSISTGTYPNGADFQTSADNGVTWVNVGHTDDYADLIATLGTLPAGSILWRVRSYNTDNAAGPWSTPAAIVVRAAPAKPTISSISSEARPVVTWQASGQQAYRVKAGALYDSGAVYGADKFHKIKVWLPDGSIKISVQIENSFGMWSPWAELATTIANIPGAEISLSTLVKNNGIVLRWHTLGAYLQYIVYRDGSEIVTVSGTEYTDYLCNGKHTYYLRGVTSAGQYTISNNATEILSPVYAYIAIAGEWDWLTLEARRGAYPARDTVIKPTVQYLHYSGRRLPVAEFSEFEDRTHSFDFTMWRGSAPGSVEKLQGMTGRLVVYKDSQGGFAAGILDSLSISRDKASDVNFTITEVSSNEL